MDGQDESFRFMSVRCVAMQILERDGERGMGYGLIITAVQDLLKIQYIWSPDKHKPPVYLLTLEKKRFSSSLVLSTFCYC